ncbi:MAG: hypothetical protein R3297_05050 [Desulfobulbales bacterium]|nr:hypothetical protein [Desulfobulbales bacterium]
MIALNKIDITPGSRIILPADQLRTVYEHCRRKLAGRYFADESPEQKAFGLVAGRQSKQGFTVSRCFPLLKNARQIEPYKSFMDNIMTRYAVPSETPLARRGWVADPQELLASVKECQRENLLLLGAYHMHRVAWQDDPRRDTPTVLDSILAADSGMLIFIISMINTDRPIIRAFYEGNPDMEIPIGEGDSTQ